MIADHVKQEIKLWKIYV